MGVVIGPGWAGQGATGDTVGADRTARVPATTCVIWLCAYVADVVRRQLDDDVILVENWEGEAPLIPLIAKVLGKAHDLIGDERDRIL